MTVPVLFLLSTVGLAITSHAQQCSEPPKGLDMHLREQYFNQKTFEDGSSVSFDCNSGYSPAEGSPQIRCSAGVWSPVLLKCQRKNCGALEEVANGYIDYRDTTSTLFGDTAVVVCNRGYILVGPSGVRRCDVQGWTGRSQTCEVVQCPPPGEIVNGAFSPQKEYYSYRESVVYSCNNKDLTINGSNNLICSEDGKFSPAPPKCVMVECKDPQIRNAVWESGSRPPHRHKATIAYKCISGYQMTGQPTLTCEINNQWSPKFPECKSNGNAVVGGLICALVTIPILLVQNHWI